MSQARTGRGRALAALRRERTPLAALGLVLLLAQLLLAGFAQGAMAAERLAVPDLSLICHTVGAANGVEPPGAPHAPDRSCPCLAGVCVVAAATLVAPVGEPVALPGAPAAVPQALAFADVPVPPRPIDRFARASRGPPVRI